MWGMVKSSVQPQQQKMVQMPLCPLSTQCIIFCNLFFPGQPPVSHWCGVHIVNLMHNAQCTLEFSHFTDVFLFASRYAEWNALFLSIHFMCSFFFPLSFGFSVEPPTKNDYRSVNSTFFPNGCQIVCSNFQIAYVQQQAYFHVSYHIIFLHATHFFPLLSHLLLLLLL